MSSQYLSRLLRPWQQCFVPSALCDVDQAIRLLFPEILMVLLLLVCVDYFNGCLRARSLGTAAQIKIMGEPSLVFTGICVGIYVTFWVPLEKYKIVS